MKFTRAVAAAAVLSMMSFAAPAESVKTDAFTIVLPEGFGAFATQAQKAQSPEGMIEATNWISKAPSGEAVVVTVSKMPGPIGDAQKAFAGTRDSLLKSLGATLESEAKVDGAHAATDLSFRSAGAFLRSRMIVNGDKLYQVLYVGRSEEQRAVPAVAQMFESFAIASADAAPPVAGASE
jgi:hypothetical protein